ncbi:MAG: response regulator transcription factor [Bacteroidetes bacterium]|nr:response regulator transcription factor [Bacteroidota bacterium]
MKRIKILLVEDNRILRDGIRDLINAQSDLVVVSSTGGGHDTVEQVRTMKPHVVLMDLGLRGEHAARIVSILAREMPHVRVIGMGLIPTQLDIIEFVEVGAAGFILKDATVAEVLQTIRLVAKGSKVLPPPLTGSLFTHVVDRALRRAKGSLTGAVRMTKREREVIALIAEGMSNKQIAVELNLSTYTVKSHIHNILEKLALHSRLEIASHFSDRLPPP